MRFYGLRLFRRSSYLAWAFLGNRIIGGGLMVLLLTLPTVSLAQEDNLENSNIAPQQSLADQDLLQLPADPLALPKNLSQLEAGPVIAISLAEALALARTNNRQLEISEKQLRQAQLGIRQAEAAYLPNLYLGVNLNSAVFSTNVIQQKFYDQLYGSVGLNYNQEQTFEVFGPQGITLYSLTPFNSPLNTLDTTLTLSYLVYGGGGRSGNLKASQEQLKIQALQVDLTLQNLNQQVRSAYYTIQQSQAQIKISQDNLNNAQVTLNDADALRQAGFATIADVLQAQVQVKNAEQQVVQAQGDLISAQSTLTQLLSLTDGIVVTAADDLTLEANWPYSLAESLQIAYDKRPELQQQLAEREVALAQRQVALAQTRPQVQLSAQTDINKILGSGSGFPEGADGDFWGGGYSLTASMQWNFYDGGSAQSQADSARVSEEIAVTQFANFHNQIRQEVTQAYTSLQVSQENYKTAMEALDFARQSLVANRTRFVAGVGTQLDVINAQTNLNQAQLNLLRAMVSYNQAIANLRKGLGQD